MARRRVQRARIRSRGLRSGRRRNSGSYDIAATHLYVPGTKLHIRNALDHGATVEQVLEVMEISSVLGIHAVTTAAPMLATELTERGIEL